MKGPFWNIPDIWRGETVYVVGGGPSIKETPLHRIHDKKVIGVNAAFTLGNWVDICWFGDCRFHEWFNQELSEFPGLIVGCPPCSCDISFPLKKVRKDTGQKGICAFRNDLVFWNNSSGASAINFAYHLGAERVVLVGFDMKMREGRHNFHSLYTKHTPSPDIYQDMFLKPFFKIAEDAERLGFPVYNATLGSDLKVFPFVDIEQTF